jgi:hypothetical protein
VEAARAVDICGEFPVVSECHGTISDGIGPYTKSADCEVRLAGFVGGRYMLAFEEFELEAGVDFVSVFDGEDRNTPPLGEFSGKELPVPLTSSSASTLPSLAVGRRSSTRDRPPLPQRCPLGCQQNQLRFGASRQSA